MVFKRKHKKSWLAHARDFIWPRIGWKRSLKYLKHRVVRLPHSARDIAMGLSFGCVVSWTPTWGLQLVQCYIFSKIFRANFPAALIGSAFGNPTTFPILLGISYIVGNFIIDVTGLYIFFEWRGVKSIEVSGDSLAGSTFIPMLIGGYVMAVLTFPLFYYAFYYMIVGARKAQMTAKQKVQSLKEKIKK
jgi:hypothetical protein